MPKHANKQSDYARRESIAKPPEKYIDCNGYMEFDQDCRILAEMFCITRGTCKFYKPKKKEIENEAK